MDKFLIAILLSKKLVRVEFVGIVSRSVMIENSSIQVESGYGEDAALNLIDISLLQIQPIPVWILEVCIFLIEASV